MQPAVHTVWLLVEVEWLTWRRAGRRAGGQRCPMGLSLRGCAPVQSCLAAGQAVFHRSLWLIS